MRRDPKSVRALTTLVAMAMAILSAAWAPPPEAELRGLLTERVERTAVAGLLVGWLEEGTPRMVAAGRRAGEGSPPPDAGTVFEIGSVSKVFTTTLLAELVARGEVALDDPIGKYLPESVRAPSHGEEEITLLHLATATSGLPRLPSNLVPTDGTDPYADYGAEDLYAFLSGYELPREPGAAYEYSNLGVGLLGHLLARRAGTGYERLVRERILEPLGMDDTRIELTPTLRDRLAGGHDANGEPAAGWTFDVLAGAGAWYSTAGDMLRFLAAALEPPEGPLGEALRVATRPRRSTGTAGLRVGLGWHVLERDGRKVVWHNGETGGYHTFIGFDPESGGNVVVLANSAVDVDDLGLHVIDPSFPLRKLPVAVEPEVLEQYVGRYEITPHFALEITREGDALFVQATGQPRFRLQAASPILFFQEEVGAEIEFTTEEAGEVTGLVLRQQGRNMPGRRVEPRGEDDRRRIPRAEPAEPTLPDG